MFLCVDRASCGVRGVLEFIEPSKQDIRYGKLIILYLSCVNVELV